MVKEAATVPCNSVLSPCFLSLSRLSGMRQPRLRLRMRHQQRRLLALLWWPKHQQPSRLLANSCRSALASDKLFFLIFQSAPDLILRWLQDLPANPGYPAFKV